MLHSKCTRGTIFYSLCLTAWSPARPSNNCRTSGPG